MRKGRARFQLFPLTFCQFIIHYYSQSALKIHLFLSIQTFVFTDDTGSQNNSLIITANKTKGHYHFQSGRICHIALISCVDKFEKLQCMQKEIR